VLLGTDYVKHATSFGDAEDSTREENIAELVSDTVQFDKGRADVGARAVGGDGDGGDDGPGAGLAGYLQHVALLTSADTKGQGPAVRMMTVHAAKGLEFDHVFVTGLEEGTFPSMRVADDPEGLEEERRLMYVALTRARCRATSARTTRRRGAATTPTTAAAAAAAGVSRRIRRRWRRCARVCAFGTTSTATV
jgi:superfamily I DNA/RNA helicase